MLRQLGAQPNRLTDLMHFYRERAISCRRRMIRWTSPFFCGHNPNHCLDERAGAASARRKAASSAWCRPWGALHRGTSGAGAAARKKRLLSGDYLYFRQSETVWTERRLTRNIRARFGKPIRRETCRRRRSILFLCPTRPICILSGFRTYVNVEGLSERLEGRSRPGHFRGVSTVVMKLLEIVQPNFAYFGRKDAQQVRIISRDGSRLESRHGDRGLSDRARTGRPGALFAECLPQRQTNAAPQRFCTARWPRPAKRAGTAGVRDAAAIANRPAARAGKRTSRRRGLRGDRGCGQFRAGGALVLHVLATPCWRPSSSARPASSTTFSSSPHPISDEFVFPFVGAGIQFILRNGRAWRSRLIRSAILIRRKNRRILQGAPG